MARGRGGRGGRSHGQRSHGIRTHGHRGFGRSRFGRHRYGHRRTRFVGGRRYRSYGGAEGPMAYYQRQMDQIYNSALTPVLFNGTLTFCGRDSSVTNHLSSSQPAMIRQYHQAVNLLHIFQQPIYQEMIIDQYFPNGVFPEEAQVQAQLQMQQKGTSFDGLPATPQPQQPQIDPMFQGLTFTPDMGDDMIVQQIQQRMQMKMSQTQQMNIGFNQLNVITVGDKDPGSGLCYCLTLSFMALIFPIFFLCCNWWKRIVYPKYRVSAEFYRAVGQFVRNNARCTTVKLTVCDNQFNSEKVHILRDGLMGTQIQSLTVVNMAKPINCEGDEVDNFVMNVRPLKEMSFTTAFIWDEQAA